MRLVVQDSYGPFYEILGPGRLYYIPMEEFITIHYEVHDGKSHDFNKEKRILDLQEHLVKDYGLTVDIVGVKTVLGAACRWCVNDTFSSQWVYSSRDLESAEEDLIICFGDLRNVEIYIPPEYVKQDFAFTEQGTPLSKSVFLDVECSTSGNGEYTNQKIQETNWEELNEKIKELYVKMSVLKDVGLEQYQVWDRR